MRITPQAEAGDRVLACGLALSPEAVSRLEGAVLDYGAGLKPPRFRVLRNPNTPVQCPCGRSFGRPFAGRSGPDCQAYRPMEWDDPRPSPLTGGARGAV